MRLARPTSLLPLLLLALPAVPFSCDVRTGSVSYDLKPLAGLRTDNKHTPTPPTTSEAIVDMELCSPDGLPNEEDVAEEDQCPPSTRVCLRLINTKPSASDPERVTAVIPIWPVDVPDSDILIAPMGQNGVDGIKVNVQGPDYAGMRQTLNLTLTCDLSATDANPDLISYSNGILSLAWATPNACPLDGDEPPSGGSAEAGRGREEGGFWGFVKFVFWAGIIGLIIYFVAGMYYNHYQYSAKGWDLVPHRDFWREFPALVQDLFSHLFAGLRGSGGGGGGGRGGYNSLG